MSSQLSAQAMTAQTAITRMSISRWSILPWQRGSSTTPRCRTRLSIDMILSSPARGHVIIHQARASNRNFMRLPWATGEVSATHDHFAGPVFSFGDLRRQRLAEVGGLEHRADIDLARHWHRIGAALHPRDR